MPSSWIAWTDDAMDVEIAKLPPAIFRGGGSKVGQYPLVRITCQAMAIREKDIEKTGTDLKLCFEVIQRMN